MLGSETPDHRRSSETDLLAALTGGDPLALAEAYHRTVAAGHAVARRLLSTSAEVEDLLLDVYTRLWVAPPDAGPLERWVRATAWELGAARLRDAGASPSTPSAARLLTDLPAPDVRYLDTAERAIAELSDEQRQVLLLAHDKGVPAAEQGPGAEEALVSALLGLAGTETPPSDRTALHEDGCDDLHGLGDWCLGLATAATAAEIEEALAERPGCAARSRALRRGRRRIEGLPATPDMGHRILVRVLTDQAAPARPAAEPAPPPDASPPAPSPPPPPPSPPPAAEEPPPSVTPAPSVTEDTGPLGEPAQPRSSLDAGPPQPPADGRPPRVDEPSDTSDLRLADILAEGDDGIYQEPPAAAGTAPQETTAEDPYAGLDDLDEEAPFGGEVTQVYVEGAEPEDSFEEPETPGGRRLAAVLAWVLPILAGGAIGLLAAILLVGR